LTANQLCCHYPAVFPKKRRQGMTDHSFAFQTTYNLPVNFFQDFQNKSELVFHPEPIDSEPTSLPAKPVETISARKERQRRQALDRAMQAITEEDLPGQEYAIRYLQHKFRRNCKTCTLSSSGTAVRFFLSMLKVAGRDLLDISREDIEAFVEREQDRKMAVKSVRNRMQAVYRFARYLVEEDIIGPDILARRIRVKLPVSLPKAIDPEDVKRLFSVIDHIRDRAFFLTLLRTGMRVGELLDLQATDLHLSEKKILIYMGEKNYRGRVVYLGTDAVEALEAWMAFRDSHQDTLFYSSQGPTITYATIRIKFKKCLEKAGLAGKGYTIHCLRHTFASEMLNAGLRLEVLQQLLGHSSIEVTRQYARLTDTTREEEYFRAMAIIERGEINGRY
jgi:site-specific recombinase XerD